jgi:pyridoxine 5-phosphate synthase
MTAPHLRLGVNIDHVATIRNARGGDRPDPVAAALIAEAAGADGITAHLREDRRHIRDGDITSLKAELRVPLNLEMAATQETLAIALTARPHAACIVPEKREEQTTEGGLDVIGGHNHLVPYVARLRDAGIRVSLFVEPDRRVLDTVLLLGVPVVELHTGTWCHALADGDSEAAEREFGRLAAAAAHGTEIGLEVHAGHGLDYDSARRISGIPALAELNIGHFLIGDAISIGLAESVRRMRVAMDAGRAAA